MGLPGNRDKPVMKTKLEALESPAHMKRPPFLENCVLVGADRATLESALVRKDRRY
jgi:hypothetical protein